MNLSVRYFKQLLLNLKIKLISVINQLDAQKFCFAISLFHASTCFEHMCSKHVEAWNKLIVKQKFCASSCLITEINVLRCTVNKTSNFNNTRFLEQEAWETSQKTKVRCGNKSYRITLCVTHTNFILSEEVVSCNQPSIFLLCCFRKAPYFKGSKNQDSVFMSL